jgi:hypothetical protein
VELGVDGTGPVAVRAVGPAGAVVRVGGAAGVAGELVARGGGSPGPPDAGIEGDEGARDAASGTIGFGARGHDGMVPVGMRSGLRGTEPGEPVPAGPGPAVKVGGRLLALLEAGAPVAGAVGGAFGSPGPPVVPGRGPGIGVSTGGPARSKAGPGRGIGVSIGICGIGPEAVGGSSRKGSGVARGGLAGGGCRRSSGSSRLKISGGGRAGRAPGSQAVQSPCGGNSAPHLRHLDTAA